MANQETENTKPPHVNRDGTQHAYKVSRQGRRQAIILLVGVAGIWIFALWTLIVVLQDGVSGVEWVTLLLMLGILVVAPVVAWTLLEEAYSRIVTSADGLEYRTLGGVNLTYPWDQVEGYRPQVGKGRIARFFLGDDEDEMANNKVRNAEAGAPRSVEISAQQAGEDSSSVVAVDGTPQEDKRAEEKATEGDEDEEEADTLLLGVREDRTNRIANPLVRFIHRLAHGRALPIYGTLENRDTLLAEIARHIAPAGQALEQPVPAPPAEAGSLPSA